MEPRSPWRYSPRERLEELEGVVASGAATKAAGSPSMSCWVLGRHVLQAQSYPMKRSHLILPVMASGDVPVNTERTPQPTGGIFFLSTS